jgi:thiamine biosynthesis lipoprotein ApbE
LTNRLQATIIADCTTRSDALATTVCVLGPEQGLRLVESQHQMAALIIVPEGGTNRVVKSSRFARSEKPGS